MKKILLGSCLLIAIALLISARWGTKAVNAPPPNELPVTDTTLAVALSVQEQALNLVGHLAEPEAVREVYVEVRLA